MKQIILLITALLTFNGFSQDFKSLYKNLKVNETQENYDNADEDILKAVDYLLTHPYNEESDQYTYALKSMLTWMNGTQKYFIIVTGRIVEACEDDKLMVNLYMASMAKYLLHERFDNNRYILFGQEAGKPIMTQKEMWEILLKGGEIFMPYLMDESQVKPNKALKKLIKAYKKGNLEKAMFE